MSGPVEIVLAAAAVGYLLVRRMAGEPAQGKRVLELPAVMGLIGLSEVSGVARTPSSVLYLAAAAVISVAFGALRGASVRISRRDGCAFVQYTGIMVALWALNLAVGSGGKFALHSFAPKDAGAIGDGLLFTLGMGHPGRGPGGPLPIDAARPSGDVGSEPGVRMQHSIRGASRPPPLTIWTPPR